eukprot:1327260-Pyramimonas_sp.AAC.1
MDDSETRGNAPRAATTDGTGRGSKRNRRRSNKTAHGQIKPRAEADADTLTSAEEMAQEDYESLGR